MLSMRSVPKILSLPLRVLVRKLQDWKKRFEIYKYLAYIPYEKIDYIKNTIMFMKGQFPRECPICGYSGYFFAFGYPPRFDAQCPSCSSLERHRLLFLRCIQNGEISLKNSVLHFAPEPIISKILMERVKNYVTADISGINVDLQINIEKMDIVDQTFDCLIANHVLEHVNDHDALREIFRILKDDGVFYCMLPVVEGWEKTYENHRINTKEGRDLHFGQDDHVRYFGYDIRSRLENAGFVVKEHTAFGEEVAKYGLIRGEKVFECKKLF